MKRARPVARIADRFPGRCLRGARWAVLLVAVVVPVPRLRAEDAAGAAPARAVDPLAVSPAMREWVGRELGAGPADGSVAWALGKLRRLHGALTQAGPASIVEVDDSTPTAGEAFASRRADCQGFAMLFASLARERGIAARFALAADVARVDRRAGLSIERAHFTVLYAGRIFDAGGERALEPARDTPVSDRAAVALFLSNRGAQILVAGEARAAVELFYSAVRSDPSLPWVWSNLGVALRRAGDPEGALLAQAMALRLHGANGPPHW